jgi:hypothetical protein
LCRIADQILEQLDQMRVQILVRDLLKYAEVVDLDSGSGQPVDCNSAYRVALENLALPAAECGAGITADPLPTVIAE